MSSSHQLMEAINSSYLSSSSRKRDIFANDDPLSNDIRAFVGAADGMTSAASVGNVSSASNTQQYFTFDSSSSAPPKKRMKLVIQDQTQLFQFDGGITQQQAGQLMNLDGNANQMIFGTGGNLIFGVAPSSTEVSGLTLPLTHHQQAFSNIGNFNFITPPANIPVSINDGATSLLLQTLQQQQHQQLNVNDSISMSATNMLNAAMVSNLLNSNPALAISMLLNGLNNNNNTPSVGNSVPQQQLPTSILNNIVACSQPNNPIVLNSNNYAYNITKSEESPMLLPLSTSADNNTANLINLLNSAASPDITALLSAILPMNNAATPIDQSIVNQQVRPEPQAALTQTESSAAAVDVKPNISAIPAPSSSLTAVIVTDTKRRTAKRRSIKKAISPVSEEKFTSDTLPPTQTSQQQRPFKMYPKDALNLPIAGAVANQLNSNNFAATPGFSRQQEQIRRTSGSSRTRKAVVEVSTSMTSASPDITRTVDNKSANGSNVTSTTATIAQTSVVNYSAGLDAHDVQQLLGSSSALSSAMNDETVVRKALQQFNKWKQERNAKGGRRASTAKATEVVNSSSCTDSSSIQSPSSTTNPLLLVGITTTTSHSPTSPSTSSTTSGAAAQLKSSKSAQNSGCNTSATALPYESTNQQHATDTDNTSTSGGTTIDGDDNDDEDESGAEKISSGGRTRGGRDASYWERRRKNNDAAKRSRDSRRRKEDEIALRCAFLECENDKLKNELDELKRETFDLKCLLYNA